MASLSERLEAAAFMLAGPGTVKDRLGSAYSTHLADLDARDFPRDVREEFATLIDALHRERALPGDTVIRASLRKLSAAEANRYALLIIRTYGCVASLKSVATLQILPRGGAPIAKFLAAEPGSVSR